MVIGEKRLLEDHSEETQKGQMLFIGGGKG